MARLRSKEVKHLRVGLSKHGHDVIERFLLDGGAWMGAGHSVAVQQEPRCLQGLIDQRAELERTGHWNISGGDTSRGN